MVSVYKIDKQPATSSAPKVLLSLCLLGMSEIKFPQGCTQERERLLQITFSLLGVLNASARVNIHVQRRSTPDRVPRNLEQHSVRMEPTDIMALVFPPMDGHKSPLQGNQVHPNPPDGILRLGIQINRDGRTTPLMPESRMVRRPFQMNRLGPLQATNPGNVGPPHPPGQNAL